MPDIKTALEQALNELPPPPPPMKMLPPHTLDDWDRGTPDSKTTAPKPAPHRFAITTNTSRALFEYVKAHPGQTFAQIVVGMNNHNPGSIGALLSQMVAQKLLVRDGPRPHTYTACADEFQPLKAYATVKKEREAQRRKDARLSRLAKLQEAQAKPPQPEPKEAGLAALTAHTTTNVDATLTERGSRYGKFANHAKITYALKQAMVQHIPGSKWDSLADDQKEALDMICHKIGRILNGDPNYVDSWVDIAGYAKLVADRLEGMER